MAIPISIPVTVLASLPPRAISTLVTCLKSSARIDASMRARPCAEMPAAPGSVTASSSASTAEPAALSSSSAVTADVILTCASSHCHGPPRPTRQLCPNARGRSCQFATCACCSSRRSTASGTPRAVDRSSAYSPAPGRAAGGRDIHPSSDQNEMGILMGVSDDLFGAPTAMPWEMSLLEVERAR
jgi:hypothetical protein